jgi:hypothetical protein
MSQHRTTGDFDFRTQLGVYDQTLREIRPHEPRLGLNQQVMYLYGGFREPSGQLYAVERKFIGPMTAGLWLMSAKDGELRLDPGCIHSTRGEVRREFGEKEHAYADQLMARLGKELSPAGEQPLDLRITDSTMKWAEGELMDLDGKLVGPALQFSTPMRAEAMFYLSSCFRMTGKVLGKPVSGFVWLDHGYWPHGLDWKEYRVFNEIQLFWEVFANEYEDGSIEWGQLCRGTRGFTWGAVLDDKGAIALAERNVRTAVDHDADDWVTKALFELDGQAWEFTAEKEGQLRQFSSARWGGYRAQCGITRRRGDQRRWKNGFTWMEGFSGRTKSEKMPRVS